MILTCPSCDTQYFADASTLTGRDRTVRCAACGHSWTVDVTDDQVESDNPNAAHAAMRERMREKRAALNQKVALTTWAASFAIFALILAGLVLARNQVAATWPQSASAFRALGLEVNRFGLEILDYDGGRTFDGTVPVLNVSGDVRNVTRRPISGPLVLISLLNEDEEEIGYMTTNLDPYTVPAGGTSRFTATLKDPPIESFKIVLSFVDPDEAPENIVDVRRPE